MREREHLASVLYTQFLLQCPLGECFCTLGLFKLSSYSYVSVSHLRRYLFFFFFFSPNTSLRSDILEKRMLVGQKLS